MPKIFTCPCGQRLSVPTKLLGQAIRCPKCSKSLRLPGPRPEPKESIAPEPSPPSKRVVNPWVVLVTLVVVVGVSAVGFSQGWWFKKTENIAQATTQPQRKPQPKVKPSPPKLPERKPEITSNPTKILKQINEFRTSIQLPSINLDDEQSKQLTTIAKQLLANEKVKTDAIVLSGNEPLETLLASCFYRLRFLDTHVTKVGIGHAKTQDKQITLLHPLAQVKAYKGGVVIYPADGQKSVPVAFPGNEIPDPLPEAKFGSPAGYPITLTFPVNSKVRDVQATLKEKDQIIPAWISSPESPANPKYPQHQSNTIALIAKSVLKHGTSYTVEVSAMVDNVKWSQSWTFTTISRDDETRGFTKAMLGKINAYRKLAGLEEVILDDKLSEACDHHALYLAENEEDARDPKFNIHSEDSQRQGYTEEGANYAPRMHIGQAPFDPLSLIESWVSAFHFRFAVLEPTYRKIGIGCAQGPRLWVGIVLPDNPSRVPAKEPAVFPAEGQNNVPLTYDGGESPDPIPESKDRNAGFPITVQFPRAKKVSAVKATLTLNDKEVDCWLSTPEKPIAEGYQRNSICLISKKPLQAKSIYQVSIRAAVNGQLWTKSWRFQTIGNTFEDNKLLNEQVVARLNLFRANAGLEQVTLSKKLSEGCYAHARYLLQNWNHPSAKGIGMHQEDPKLPGYTEEGRRAGLASVIATGSPGVDSVEDWMATLYHRIPLLDPDLREIGFGMVRGGPRSWITVLDSKSGVKGGGVRVYPAEDQKGVAGKLQSDAIIAQYLQADQLKAAGYPISMTFPVGHDVKQAQIVLSDQENNEIPVWTLKPEIQGSRVVTLFIIPRQSLTMNTTYTVEMKARSDRRIWEKTWSFQTR